MKWVLEYNNKTITRLFGGNRLRGCYFLAGTIFTIGIIRDLMYVMISTGPILSVQVAEYVGSTGQRERSVLI